MPAEPALAIDLPDAAATAGLAARLAPLLRRGDFLALAGDLGCGKTTFARALIQALNGADEVPSPTFTLVQTYETRAGPLSHFDLYRIHDPGELAELGWDEALGGGIVLAEWPDRAGDLLPEDHLRLTLAYGSAPDARQATLMARGPRSREILLALESALQSGNDGGIVSAVPKSGN